MRQIVATGPTDHCPGIDLVRDLVDIDPPGVTDDNLREPVDWCLGSEGETPMKSMTVVGTRPEFVQIAPLTKALRGRGYEEILVNTGQHYDDNMSQVFFRELDLPRPDLSLGIGSGGHAEQTGRMMIALEEVMLDERPDWVIVYGDTNSTIAAALVAAKIHIPIVHVEAGLRAFDRRMPEEVNRILTDHISDILFAPTQFALDNLANEGIVHGVHNVGDVRIDVLASAVELARPRQADLLDRLGFATSTPFAIATIHRPSNTDDEGRLRALVDAFDNAAVPLLLPVHPRLAKMLQTFGLGFGPNVRTVEPLGFLDLIAYMGAASVVITDSGGLQKEAYMLARPAVTMRDTTEWVETVDAGWNRLCEPVPAEFDAALADALHNVPDEHPGLYGTPGVGERMVDVMARAHAVRRP